MSDVSTPSGVRRVGLLTIAVGQGGQIPVARRVTTATPATLDFKPPRDGRCEGCVDTMSTESSFSMG